MIFQNIQYLSWLKVTRWMLGNQEIIKVKVFLVETCISTTFNFCPWKKGTSDIPHLYFVLEKINELHSDFGPWSYFDSKLYIKKLKRIAKGLKKKIQRQKPHKKNFWKQQNRCVSNFNFCKIFFIFLTEATNLWNIFIK